MPNKPVVWIVEDDEEFQVRAKEVIIEVFGPEKENWFCHTWNGDPEEKPNSKDKVDFVILDIHLKHGRTGFECLPDIPGILPLSPYGPFIIIWSNREGSYFSDVKNFLNSQENYRIVRTPWKSDQNLYTCLQPLKRQFNDEGVIHEAH